MEAGHCQPYSVTRCADSPIIPIDAMLITYTRVLARRHGRRILMRTSPLSSYIRHERRLPLARGAPRPRHSSHQSPCPSSVSTAKTWLTSSPETRTSRLPHRLYLATIRPAASHQPAPRPGRDAQAPLQYHALPPLNHLPLLPHSPVNPHPHPRRKSHTTPQSHLAPPSSHRRPPSPPARHRPPLPIHRPNPATNKAHRHPPPHPPLSCLPIINHPSPTPPHPPSNSPLPRSTHYRYPPPHLAPPLGRRPRVSPRPQPRRFIPTKQPPPPSILHHAPRLPRPRARRRPPPRAEPKRPGHARAQRRLRYC